MQRGRNSMTVSIDPLERRARVVVADPFPIVLVGIRKVIEDDPRLQIVGEVSTMPLLLEKVTAEEPDIVLLDWSLAAQDLKGVTALLHPDLPRTSLVILTATENEQEKRAMLRLGVHGVVSKRTTASELQAAVWQAWRCGTALRSPATEIAGMSKPPARAWTEPDQRLQQLTRRERQLIPLVCGGMRNKAIAQYLGIAESTVWHHLTAVFTKLQVDDRLGLAAFAYRNGLVVPSARLSPVERLSAD